MRRYVKVIAHRGARSLAPENTIAAARKALELGSDLWETDVAVTADEKLILFHDDSLKRTTDVEEAFPDRAPWVFTTFTLQEIRSLDAGSWFVDEDPFGQIAAGAVSPEEAESYRGEKIPTLEEALEFTRDAGWAVNLELKRLPSPMEDFPVVQKVLEAIRRVAIPLEEVVISSFVHRWLREMHTLEPRLEIQALIGYFPSKPIDWSHVGEFHTYNSRNTLTPPEKVRELVQKGEEVNIFTVNEPDEAKRYIEAGVSGLFTDFPQRIVGICHDG